MFSFEATTVIAAPAERVWSIIADVVLWPQWLPTVTSVEPLGAPQLALGAQYRIVQPRLKPAIWSVVDLSARSYFSWESHSHGVRTLAAHVLRPINGSSTSVSLQVTFSGLLAGPVGLVAGSLTREYIQREAAALKQVVERVSQ